MDLFNCGKQPLKIDKPIRLIELFAGIGSQAKALERLGADFEHYRVCEFDKYAINSYNAIHETNFVTSDITQITADDLGIVDTDKYCYIMTYSFPCQDLSLAGKQKGMAKGENTRSGLLWEVERLLNECTELPQILLMENVTQVHGKKNKELFDEWIDFLENKGYSNYWKDLNAKNFGIPQNRNRTFMVSVLGGYTYEFPKEFPLELRLKHLLEDCVDEKYYLSGKMVDYLHSITEKNIARGNGNVYSPSDVDGCSKYITTKEGSRVKDNFIEEPKCEQVGMLSGGKWDKMHDISRRVYSGDGVAPTIHTCGGGNLEPKIIDDFYKNRDERVYEDVSPTLRADRNGLKVVEPRVIGGIGEKKSNGGTQWYQQDRIYDNELAISVTTGFFPYYKVEEPLAYDEQNGYIRKDGTVGTLTTDGSSPKHNIRVVEGMRIRKLTPKECWRLMGFDDADFEKAARFNSNSQLYKQAGNSIVVDVLYYIFKGMM
jgi:DNA (cytosine-5)-methyltransferase 1